ncbi:MAG TPA: hypothetical protein PK867_11740 [Pirellulales bacterium]|nr:hypothetical protein [Pirellulales bacterium]
MAKKDGDLRLLKSGTVYGPMSRSDFDRLRAGGKIGSDDLVSVRGGAWTPVDDYFAVSESQAGAGPRGPAPLESAVAARLSPDDTDPVLRLLTGKRIVRSLSRAEVNQLHQSGRIDDDDLICALYGPWMRVVDFLAPPRTKPPATLLEEHHAANGPTSATAATSSADAQPAPPLIARPVVPAPAPASGVPSFVPPPASRSPLRDEWFVRVRGVHSAPLGKRHVKSLFDAKEITRDNVARHPTWLDNAWLPIHAIPQLADAVT